jgi:hypothetical protein
LVTEDERRRAVSGFLPLLRERGLENAIRATSRYESLTGDQYETSWVINPLLIAAERSAPE